MYGGALQEKLCTLVLFRDLDLQLAAYTQDISQSVDLNTQYMLFSLFPCPRRAWKPVLQPEGSMPHHSPAESMAPRWFLSCESRCAPEL